MHIQDAISQEQKVAQKGWKEIEGCSEIEFSSPLANQTVSGQGPEHCPVTVCIVKLLTQPLQSFGSCQLQLWQTLPRHG